MFFEALTSIKLVVCTLRYAWKREIARFRAFTPPTSRDEIYFGMLGYTVIYSTQAHTRSRLFNERATERQGIADAWYSSHAISRKNRCRPRRSVTPPTGNRHLVAFRVK